MISISAGNARMDLSKFYFVNTDYLDNFVQEMKEDLLALLVRTRLAADYIIDFDPLIKTKYYTLFFKNEIFYALQTVLLLTVMTLPILGFIH